MKIYFADRLEQVKLFEDLTLLNNKTANTEFSITPSRYEYYVFQLLIFSKSDIPNFDVTCNQIVDAKNNKIDAVTCFNSEGTDKFGKPFKKKVSVKANEILPIFIGIDLSKCDLTTYLTTIEIKDIKVKINIDVTDKIVVNNGYDDLKSLSRLNWLNSTLYQDNSIAKGYTPIIQEGNLLKIIGRDITIADNGLPSSVASYFDQSVLLKDCVQTEMLQEPIIYVLGDQTINYSRPKFENLSNHIVIKAEGYSEKLLVNTSTILTYEGKLSGSIKVTAKQDVILDNISLKTMFTKDASTYNNGLGLDGGYFRDLDFKWNKEHQDCIYVGNINSGARLKFLANNYSKPLINIYYANKPLIVPTLSWDNKGKGGIRVKKVDNGAIVEAYTGYFVIPKDTSVSFEFEMHFTPFKPIDYNLHYGTRYCHNNRLRNYSQEINNAAKNKLNYIILHHGNGLHPYINYPFIATKDVKKFVDAAHKYNIGTKLYYTVREMSNQTAEIFAYKALGNEIVYRKEGKGYPWKEGTDKWLTKYFGKDIIPAWRVRYVTGKYRGTDDISFIVTPDSRLDNYYIEGLDWLVKNIGIDGIYIDDTSLDRTTVERARKVLDNKKGLPGLIDMHMWNHHCKDAGNVSCTNLYTDIFPFIDNLWIGEGYEYNKLTPDFIMTEVSGMCYGNTSAMLHGGGNPYLGMLYAMTSRYGWGTKKCINMYKLWDKFKIKEAKMLGYWHKDNPIIIDNPNIFATVYLQEKSCLVAVFNFSDKKQEFDIGIDNKKLQFSSNKNKYKKVYIKGLQKTKRIDLDKQLVLASKKGIIFKIY